MPNISEYLLLRFGISIYMYYGDENQHHVPHIHARYQGEEAVFGIPSGEVLDGTLPGRTARQVKAWIALNEEALTERWQLAVRRIPITKVD